ncbi:MAG: prepilin-type N-terminal cleavage/methylation domain-containing protein [Gemmatimonadota bacterium]
MVRNRGGFTLVELIVVSVLGVVVLAAALQVLITNQRTYTVQSATIQGQQSSRMAIEVMFNELRELSPGDGDILMMASDSLRVRLMRRLGVTCDVDLGPLATPPKITVLDNTGDDFEAGDTVLVFAENREATDNDDVWLRAGVVDVDTTVTCLGGREAIDLEFDPLSTIFSSDTVRVGAPVRGYEVYKYEVATWITTNTPYLVRRDGGVGTPWPIAGPLRPGNQGLQFTYRDALGAITTTPTDVRQIQVMIRTGNRVRNSAGDVVSDSLDTWIHTRN